MLGDGTISVRQTRRAGVLRQHPAPGADALAVSAAWVAWRAREAAGDALYAAPLAGGAPRLVARAPELGRPALEGDRLAYHVAGRTGSHIVIADLAAGTQATVRSERRALLLNPSLLDGRLLYVRALFSRQELRVGPQTQARPAARPAAVVDRADRPPRRRPRAGRQAQAPRAAAQAVAAAPPRPLADPVDDRAGGGRGLRHAAAPGRPAAPLQTEILRVPR